ncbi:alpha/beta hydrolase family protein [Rhodobacter capsulatus]|uniref:alpha/beta hydrolase family protein n=1 Tax=Rhodobacter capsulatus TaxID=1061 RepID=UPI0040251A04
MTWCCPQAPGPFPAVLLLAGSGPQDRDEHVAGHRPFLVLSDALARAGIASLRYDKRGVGGSAGRFRHRHDFGFRP